MKLAAQRLSNTTVTVSECDDCTLGPLEIQVNSKIAHIDARGDALVDKFHRLVSSCNASGYSYTSPAPYGQAIPTAPPAAAAAENATTTTSDPSQGHKHANLTSRSSRPAVRQYVVQDGDTCNSIAAQNSVSMFSIIEANNLDVWCRLLAPGETISIPETCVIHKVAFGDTCWALAQQYGTTKEQIIELNANINSRCTNLEGWESSYICVGL
jgi:LysM repeat protein